LVSVTIFAALAVITSCAPNVKLAGEKLTAAPSPIPVRLTVCGLPGALSAMVTAALRDPAAAGVNVTLMLQGVPGVRLVPHVLVSIKSLLFAPVTLTLVMFKLAVPLLVRVTDFVPLLVPRF